MNFEFTQNEFTCWDILEYLKCTYGHQINGNPFSSSLLQQWIRLKKMPEAYGGNSIIQAIRYKELGNLLVLTIEGLTREHVKYFTRSFDTYEETANRQRKQDTLLKNKTPSTQRTKLYFQILERSDKRYAKKTHSKSAFPKYWKEAGIKKNQFANKGKSISS